MNNLMLNKLPLDKWIRNIVIFLAPVGVLYLTTVIGVISQDNHLFSLKDLVPTQFALGGIVLWFLNAGLDYLRKLKAQ